MYKESEIVLLIPHYNNFSGLLKSVNSIDEESNIDVLVVDDGSVESTINEELLFESCPNDVNINIIYNTHNRGIEIVLNQGLEFIKSRNYRFIARLDCGDINLKNRLTIQSEYLKRHPEVGIVGSFVRFNDTNGKHLYDLKLPTSNIDIQNKIYFNSMFLHPAIMITNRVLSKVNNYPIKYPAAEDYAFIFQILKFYKGANIDEFLVICEVNPNGISISRRKVQVKSRIMVILDNFKFGYYPIVGLIRNMLLLILPYGLILYLKKMKIK